jgi:hypothetical protein
LQIRESFSKFLDGTVSPAEFEDWFVPQTWNIQSSRDSAAESLLDEIQTLISGYTSGQLSEPEFRDSLLRFVRQTKRPTLGKSLLTV